MNKRMNECLMAPSSPTTADVNDGFPCYSWVFWRGEGTGFAEGCYKAIMVMALKS